MSSISIKLATLTAILALAAGSVAFAAPPSSSGQKEDAQSLGTITISGSKLRLLQDIKAALKRPFSYHAVDRDAMVCRIQLLTGSRLHKALVCGTNHAWYTRADRAQINWSTLYRGGTLEQIKAKNMAFQIPLVSAADFKRFIESVPSEKAATAAAKSSDQQH